MEKIRLKKRNPVPLTSIIEIQGHEMHTGTHDAKKN